MSVKYRKKAGKCRGESQAEIQHRETQNKTGTNLLTWREHRRREKENI